MQERIDDLFAPLTQTLLTFAAPAPGARVLDIGCGCGATLLALASRVGLGGSVFGVDVSQPMLSAAAQRTAHDGRIRVVEADASAYAFPPAAFDLLFSRFGVMFFDEPVAAFAHLRGTLAPGGRLAFATWRRISDNPWFLVPFAAVAPLLPPRPPADPHAPGPFAFADPERTRDLLEQAGFRSVDVVRHDLALQLWTPGQKLSAASFAAQIGPAASLLAEADDVTKAAAHTAIRDALAGYETESGLSLPASVWLVSAQA